MAKAPATGSSGSTSGSKWAYDKLDLSTLAKDFKVPYAVLKSNKELQGVFNQWIAGHGDASDLTSLIQGTSWYQKLGATGAEAAYLEGIGKGNPDSIWSRRMAQMEGSIRDQAAKMGASLSDKQVANLSRQSLYGFYDQGQVTDYMSAYIKADSQGNYQGDAQSLAEKLHQYMGSMGVISDPNAKASWLDQSLRDVASGRKTDTDVQTQIANWAASKYTFWADQIKEGKTVSDLASAYVSSAQGLLEDSSIDINDNTVQKLLFNTDPKTGQATPSTIFDFEKNLRSDPRWQQTKNAKDTYQQAAQSLATAMGFNVV